MIKTYQQVLFFKLPLLVQRTHRRPLRGLKVGVVQNDDEPFEGRLRVGDAGTLLVHVLQAEEGASLAETDDRLVIKVLEYQNLVVDAKRVELLVGSDREPAQLDPACLLKEKR
jgi:hypothetical protein